VRVESLALIAQAKPELADVYVQVRTFAELCAVDKGPTPDTCRYNAGAKLVVTGTLNVQSTVFAATTTADSTNGPIDPGTWAKK
jgi:hypothetical protein